MTTTQSTDRDAIAATLTTYIDGARSGRVDDLRPAFHENATIHGHLGPDLIAQPIAFFYQWHEENGPASTIRADITSIDIAGAVATARMEIRDWTGHDFTDLFTLLRTDAGWQIVSKVFHLHS